MCWSTGRADRAAAGQRDRGLAEAREQRAEHEDRRAHGLHQIVRCLGRADRAGVERNGVGLRLAALGLGAHVAQQLERGAHVLQARHVSQRDRIGRQQRGAEFGQRGVLGAGDDDFAFEPAAAADEEFVHEDECFAPMPTRLP
jgi:hypothetical protein